MTEKLKPCPFCGGKDIETRGPFLELLMFIRLKDSGNFKGCSKLAREIADLPEAN